MGFFDYVIVCSIRWSLNQVLRDSYIHSLQFRHIDPGLSKGAGRNLSEKLVMVRIRLLKHSKSTGCAHEVDASGGRIELDFVGAAHAVQRLNHFPRLSIHDDQLPRFILVSAFDPATNKQAMMDCVQTRSMRCRPSSDWPLGDDRAFLQINDLEVT